MQQLLTEFKDGQTALYCAVNYRQFECLKFLVENGADPEIKDNVIAAC